MRNPQQRSPLFNSFPFTLTRISAQIWIFMAILSLTLIVLGFQFGGRGGLWIGFLIASTFFCLIYFFAEPPLLSFFKAQKIQGQDSWGLLEISNQASKTFGIINPDLFVFDSPSVTSFSLGPAFRRPCIALSTELLKRLSPEEIRAVVIHQCAHIQTLSRFNFSVLSSFVHSITGFAAMMDSVWPTNWSKHHLKFRPFLTILAPLAGTLLRLAQSDRKYFDVDELAAKIVNDNSILATTLWKIDRYCQARPLDIPPCTNHFFIANPEGSKESNWFFVTHPAIEARVRRLVGTYPL